MKKKRRGNEHGLHHRPRAPASNLDAKGFLLNHHVVELTRGRALGGLGEI